MIGWLINIRTSPNIIYYAAATRCQEIAKDQEFSVEPFEFHNQGSLAYIGNWCVIYCFYQFWII